MACGGTKHTRTKLLIEIQILEQASEFMCKRHRYVERKVIILQR